MWPAQSATEPYRKRRDVLFSFYMLILAAMLIWVFNTHGPVAIRHFFGPLPFEAPVDFLLFLAATLAAMLLHEAGHLLVSLVLGFRILGGSIGPLQIQRLPGDWKLTWSLKKLFTGSVSAVPRGMNYWRQAMIAVVAAGPLTTLGAGLTAANFHPAGHAVILLQISFVQVSMVLFLLGLIPNSRQARRQNDARLLLDLTLRNQGAEEMELRVLLKQYVLSGERPQDYSRALLVRLAAFRGRSESQLLFALAMANWAMDSEQIELADAWDMRALGLVSECGAPIQNSALASSACFDVIFREDMESAREKFALVDCSALFPTSFAQRASAAKEIAAGHLHRAPRHILRAQYALPRGNGYYALERFLLDRLHMKVLTASAARDRNFKAASA